MEKYIELVNKIERYLLSAIREKRGAQRDEILRDSFDKIAKITELGTKKETVLFLPMLASVENELLKFGYTISECIQSQDFFNLTDKLEQYACKITRKNKLAIGIYWIVEGTLFLHRQIIEKVKNVKRVDSDFAHFKEWDLHEKDCGNADFATYPRGRIMFDVTENQHVIFADKCVTEEQIERIVKLCYIKKYKIEYDEHYRCDKCLDNGDI